jgi:hypothetical protein
MDGWTDADGQPQFRIRNGVDTSMTIGDRPMDIDLSYRPWEISTAAVAALQKELSSDTEQLIAERIAAAIAELPAPKDGIDLEVVQQLINKALSASPKTSHRRKTGPKVRWRMFAAKAACDFYLKHGRDPTAKELIESCQNEIVERGLLKKGKVLDDGSVYELLRFIGAT